MKGQDFQFLEELLDTIDQLQQRKGDHSPDRSYPSFSRKIRENLADFADKCQRGELKGQARKRRSGKLFLKIVSLAPGIWK